MSSAWINCPTPFSDEECKTVVSILPKTGYDLDRIGLARDRNAAGQNIQQQGNLLNGSGSAGMLEGCTAWPEEFARVYREKGYWEDITLWQMLSRVIASAPDKIAIVSQDRRTSYRELGER